MLKARGGRIVNISSIGVKFGGSPTSLHYSAAKLALEGVTAVLSQLRRPSASEAVDSLSTRIAQFAGDALTDDLCMLAACIA